MMKRALCALALTCAAAAAAQQQGAAGASSAAPAPAPRLDDAAIRDAVKATVAEMPALPPPDAKADFKAGAAEAGNAFTTQEQIDRAFSDAVVESCWGAGALKHNPAVISLGGVPIALGGLAVLPHVFYAAASGKCK